MMRLPNLPDAVVRSIFQGLPYPASLFQACIRRIRAEQSVNIVRAAIIKAYLNRLNENNNHKKIRCYVRQRKSKSRVSFVEGYLPYLTRYRRMPMVFIPFENAI